MSLGHIIELHAAGRRYRIAEKSYRRRQSKMTLTELAKAESEIDFLVNDGGSIVISRL
jgi:hypothetical protein